jgi:hypothetical protein
MAAPADSPAGTVKVTGAAGVVLTADSLTGGVLLTQQVVTVTYLVTVRIPRSLY